MEERGELGWNSRLARAEPQRWESGHGVGEGASSAGVSAVGDQAGKRAQSARVLLLRFPPLALAVSPEPWDVLHTQNFVNSSQDDCEIRPAGHHLPGRRLTGSLLGQGESSAVDFGLSSCTAQALVGGVVVRTADASESPGLCGWHWEALALIRAAQKGRAGPLYGGCLLSECEEGLSGAVRLGWSKGLGLETWSEPFPWSGRAEAGPVN